MRISRAALAATVLAGATAVGFAVSVGTASADSDEKLPIKSFGDIAVDSVHKRVFVSDPTSGKIVSTNYQGHEAAEVTGLPGVNGLVLSADSSTLYAAVSGTHQIVALAADTLKAADSYPVGDTVPISDVVGPIHGKLWFSTVSRVSGSIGSVDLTTDEVKVHDAVADGLRLHSSLAIATGAGAPGLIVLSDIATTSGESVVYDVSSGAASLKLVTEVPHKTNYDVAFSGDGAELIQTDYSGSNRIALSDGTKTSAYPGLAPVPAVEVAADGRIALASVSSDRREQIHVYQPGATEAESTFTLPTVSGSYNPPRVVNRSLAWEPGGSRLFVVGDGDGEANYWLYTVNDADPVEPDPTMSSPSAQPTQSSAGPQDTQIQLNMPYSTTWAKGVTLTGTLTSTGSIPVGTELTVNRSSPGTGSNVVIGTVKTGASGSFSLVDKPPFSGHIDYLVRFAGNALLKPTAQGRAVIVEKAQPALALTATPAGGVRAYGSTVSLTATLGTTYSNRIVEFWADPAGNDQAPRLIKRAVVYSNGKMLASVPVTRNTVVTVKFTGDPVHLPASRSVSLWTGVAASTTLTKHYKTAKIGGVSYQYFRKSVSPVVNQTMTAAPNRKVRSVVQIWSGGKWQLWSARDTKLTTAGKASFSFTTAAKAGSMFRVRAEYIIGTSGDSLNANTQGAWKYFTLTN